MNDTKNFLTSKSFQGTLVMVLTALFGDQLGESDAADVARGIAILLAAVWTIWGRIQAKKRLTLGKGKSGLMTSLVLVLAVSVTGCAGTTAIEQVSQLPGPDQARFYAGQLARTWLDLDDGYRSVWVTASPQDKQWMSDKLKPAIEMARPVVDSLISAAKVWTIAAEQSSAATSAEMQHAAMSTDQARRDYEALKAEAENLLHRALELFSCLKTKE